MLVAQSCPPLCKVDCRLPGSSLHGILQARILERVAIPSSRGSSLWRDRTQVFCTAGRFFTTWAPREDPASTELYTKIKLTFCMLTWKRKTSQRKWQLDVVFCDIFMLLHVCTYLCFIFNRRAILYFEVFIGAPSLWTRRSYVHRIRMLSWKDFFWYIHCILLGVR